MLLKEERELITEYGRKMSRENLVKGTGGNISIFSRKDNLMVISPGSKAYDTIAAEDVMVTDLEGKVIEGRCKPSSEFRMHAIFYAKRKDINSVVHTHSINATALSCLRINLPPIYYLTIAAGPEVRCAPYALMGTSELAQAAFETMQNDYAVLLANHGVLTAADNLDFAYYLAEQVEYAAELYIKSRIVGQPVNLKEHEINDMVTIFDTLRYGKKQ
ncbi:MAG: L-fuculose-phosphate aldolase [Treponema sp.]|jgi:L-fuculose-phosphate aldolase|nr:L-fuculose-phosphate aldolase [Treponema sp.]